MSDQDLWTAVDGYIGDHLVRNDDALLHALASSKAAGLPDIAVSPAHGKLLHLLARMIGARRILEIGTLGGYSTICLARALPAGGVCITLEIEAAHAHVAARNIERAGVSERVEIRLGAALDSLERLVAERALPFDLVFIDADKQNIPAYFDFAVRLSRPGAAIIVDNVVRKGAVIDPASTDANVQGVRRFNEALQRDRRVEATAVQTVGVKGYDGFAIAIVN
jgi:predicted O-methyltransferase YrrM